MKSNSILFVLIVLISIIVSNFNVGADVAGVVNGLILPAPCNYFVCPTVPSTCRNGSALFSPSPLANFETIKRLDDTLIEKCCTHCDTCPPNICAVSRSCPKLHSYEIVPGYCCPQCVPCTKEMEDKCPLCPPQYERRDDARYLPNTCCKECTEKFYYPTPIPCGEPGYYYIHRMTYCRECLSDAIELNQNLTCPPYKIKTGPTRYDCYARCV